MEKNVGYTATSFRNFQAQTFKKSSWMFTFRFFLQKKPVAQKSRETFNAAVKTSRSQFVTVSPTFCGIVVHKLHFLLNRIFFILFWQEFFYNLVGSTFFFWHLAFQ